MRGSGATIPQLEGFLEAARMGSREALGQLLEVYRPLLLPLAERRLPADLRSKVGASDLIQETLTEAFLAFERFSGQTEEELLAWLQRILANNAINLARRFRSTGKRCLDRERSIDRRTVRTTLGDRLADPSPSPPAEVELDEEAEAMERALRQLPEDYRRVIVLRHRENQSFAEVAQTLDRTEAATRKLWARAVERWRQEVESVYGPP